MEISVAAITYNERALIKPWILHLKKIRQIKEIIIVDAESTDGTAEAAQEVGAIVKVNPWPNHFGKQRRVAIDIASREWVWPLDIDEFLCGREKDLQKTFDMLNLANLDEFNTISLTPSVAFWDWHTIWFAKRGADEITDQTIIDGRSFHRFAPNPILRKDAIDLPEWEAGLHEGTPIKEPSRFVFDLFNRAHNMKQLMGGKAFFSHYPKVKLWENAVMNGTSIIREIGQKRVRYRLISPYTYGEHLVDKKYAQQALSNSLHHDWSMIDQLGTWQMEEFCKDRLWYSNPQIFGIHPEPIRTKFWNRKYHEWPLHLEADNPDLYIDARKVYLE